MALWGTVIQTHQMSNLSQSHISLTHVACPRKKLPLLLSMSALKRVSERPDLVIKFLENQGFSQAQVSSVVRKVPMFLLFDPEKTFLPKIDFFKSRGVSSSDIPKLIANCPNVMRRSLSNHLIPSFDFFRDLFQSNDKLIRAVKCYSGILLDIDTHAVPNINLFREEGVPKSNIIKFLQYCPRAMTTTPVRFKKIVDEVKEMGFNPLTTKFLMAVCALTSLSKSTWATKVDAYKKWGWSDNDILVAFRRSPFCIKTSGDKIDAIMEFLVNKLGCEPSTVTSYSMLLSLSLNKRIVGRASVLQVLLSKGQVKKENLLAIFTYIERVFLDKFILLHEKEARELLKLYQAKWSVAIIKFPSL